jgi:limonene 1,2-monooxygenase
MDENPTLCLRRDIELMQLLDRLGFAEAWIGEHHSAGWEIISSPELFIAAAAETTRYIRFGTGVVSLPYHNPLMVAERLIQLDHQVMGRLMCGFGPGLLSSDALMLGVDPEVTRERMGQALDVVLRLFRGETVTERTDWYDLREARAHLRPYQHPHPEVAVASVLTPSGAKLAGRYGLSMLCMAASELRAFDALSSNWDMAVEIGHNFGHELKRSDLRLVAPIHIAETREIARQNVRFGLQRYIDYMNPISRRFQIPDGTDPVDYVIDSGFASIGTPDDAIRTIERLQGQQGEFGCFLVTALNWADWEATKRSYEMYARYVIPHFSGSNRSRHESFESVTANQAELMRRREAATQAAIDKHEAEMKSKSEASA